MQLFLNIAKCTHKLVKCMHQWGKQTLPWPSWPTSHACTPHVVSSTHVVTITFVVELSESRAYFHPLGAPYFHSLRSIFFLQLGVYVCASMSFSPSEPGRALGESVLIDFEVVAVGNASHGLNMLDTQKS